MLTTTYGYKLPETGDVAKGSSGWFEAIEFDISRLDSHNHDGVNSPPLSLNAFAPYTSTILAAGWSLVGNGIYKQTITVPVGITDFDSFLVEFIGTAPAAIIGQRLHLIVDKITNTTYELYCNDNTVALTAIYK